MGNAKAGDRLDVFMERSERHLAVIETRLCGKQLLIASCGTFGERVFIGLLKMTRNCARYKENFV